MARNSARAGTSARPATCQLPSPPRRHSPPVGRRRAPHTPPLPHTHHTAQSWCVQGAAGRAPAACSGAITLRRGKALATPPLLVPGAAGCCRCPLGASTTTPRCERASSSPRPAARFPPYLVDTMHTPPPGEPRHHPARVRWVSRRRERSSTGGGRDRRAWCVRCSCLAP